MKIFVADKVNSIATGLPVIDEEISCCTDEIRALNRVERWQPDLILLSYALCGDQTPDYIRLLIEIAPQAKVVLLGMAVADEIVTPCLLAGAKGYQELQSFPKYSSRMLQAVAGGEAWISRKLVAKLIDSARSAAGRSSLSSV